MLTFGVIYATALITRDVKHAIQVLEAGAIAMGMQHKQVYQVAFPSKYIILTLDTGAKNLKWP